MYGQSNEVITITFVAENHFVTNKVETNIHRLKMSRFQLIFTVKIGHYYKEGAVNIEYGNIENGIIEKNLTLRWGHQKR